MNNVVKNSKTSPKKSVTAKQLAKSNLTKRKNPDWDNLDRGYRYLTLDMKLPHDLAVAVMGNVVEESLGDYKAALKNGGGRGLIQWDGRKAPSGRYNLWGSIWASVAKPANVYDSTTDTVKNYWAPWGGLKGDKVRLKFIKAPLKEKARIYAESYLRPGKPRIADRQLSAMQLDSIYNPRIKDVIVLKDGGMLEFLKNGSGIHIKKKNKGKFTSYCGGKVTNECILKGKNSSNPAIRKRATFADNARHFKHEKGGELIKKALWGDLLPTAEKAEDRYKNGEFFKEFYDGQVGPYNIGHTVVEGVRTNKPFHKLGFIQRKIRYVMRVPSDTTFTEIPPSFLPVKKAARVATRYSDWKNNMYAGNLKDLYNTLKNRWEKANLVMRRKNGGILKAQYGAPLNISSEDVLRGLKFLNNGLNKVLGVLNTPVAGSAPTIAYLPNGLLIEIPGTLGGAPDILPGKIGGAKKLLSVAKIKDKGLTVTKQLDSAVRHDMVNIDLDLRHYGFKTKRISPEELIDKMKKYREFRGYSDHLTKRLNNLKRDNKQSMKDFKALKNKYEDMFNDFLHNGIKKGQLGMALTLFDDSENPNAVGGDIVNSYIQNQLMIPYLNKLKEDYEKWKLLMQQQSNTLKSSLFDNLLNTGLSIGTDYLKSKLGIGTEKADS